MTYGDWLMIALAIIVIVLVKYRSHVSSMFTSIGAAWTARRSRTTTAPSPRTPATSAGRKAIGLSVVAIVVGLVIAWFPGSQVETGAASMWAWRYWFQIFVAFCVVLFLAETNNVSASAKGVLHQVLVGAMFILFIGFPVWEFLNPPAKHARGTSSSISGREQHVGEDRVRCPDASTTQTRNCVLGEAGSEWIRSEVRLSGIDYAFCRDTGPVRVERELRNGIPYFRYTPTTTGPVELRYRIYKGDCPPGRLPE